jgi:hypothetical protein
MPFQRIRRTHLGILSVVGGALAAVLIVLVLIGIPLGNSSNQKVFVVWVAPGTPIAQILKIKQATYAVQGASGCAFWSPNTIPLSARSHLSVYEWFALKGTLKAASIRCQVLSVSQVADSIASIEGMRGVIAARVEPLADWQPPLGYAVH